MTAAARAGQAELILDAAARFFAERGFPGASMSDLAHECGISKALVYHYYTNKEALLYDITERYMARLVALCDEIESQTLPPRAHLRALIRRFLDEYQTSQSRHMVLTHDAKFLDAPRRRIIVARQRHVIDAFRRAISAATGGRLAAADALPAAMLVFGMINWTFTWLKAGGPMSYDEFADWVIAMVESGIGGLPPQTTPRPAPRLTMRPAPQTTPRPAPQTTPRPVPQTTPRPAPTKAARRNT